MSDRRERLDWSLSEMREQDGSTPRIEVEEIVVATREDQLKGQIGLLNERFAGLEGHLFGRDGTNGAFGDVRSDIKALGVTVDKMHADIHGMNEEKVAAHAQFEHKLGLMSKDIDAVGEIARENRDRNKDTVKRFRSALIGLGVVAAGAAIWAGVQALI